MAWKWLHMTRFSAVMDIAHHLFLLYFPSLLNLFQFLFNPFHHLVYFCLSTSKPLDKANPYRVTTQPVTSLPAIPTTAPVQSCYRLTTYAALSLSLLQPPYNCLPLARALPGTA
ncbi:hypothetical protein GGI42DRAFT_256214 [Trichoderma sp. SZMC 28013]